MITTLPGERRSGDQLLVQGANLAILTILTFADKENNTTLPLKKGLKSQQLQITQHRRPITDYN